mgnify:CR=1 FL=1
MDNGRTSEENYEKFKGKPMERRQSLKELENGGERK